MYTHTITIFNIVDGVYHRQVVKDVFYHSELIISPEGMGEKYQNAHKVIFSQKALSKYVEKNDFRADSKTFTLKVNDLVVKGEIEQIEDISSVQKAGYEYFLIKTISDNRYGSKLLQNIEVTD